MNRCNEQCVGCKNISLLFMICEEITMTSLMILQHSILLRGSLVLLYSSTMLFTFQETIVPAQIQASITAQSVMRTFA